MQLTLIKKESINSCILPEKKNGQYWITEKDAAGCEKNVISVEGYKEKWFLISNKKVIIRDENNNKLPKAAIEPLQFYNVYFLEFNESALIYSEPITADRRYFKKLLFCPGNKIMIGRNSDCDIAFENNFVSSKHAEINVYEKNITIKDLCSSNGTFVNGFKVKEKALAPGDVVYILGLKVIIGKGFLAVNNPDNKVKYNEKVLKKFIKQEIEVLNDEEDDDEVNSDNLFYRSPRFKKDVERVKIRIDSPPALGNQDEMPLMLILGPSLAMGMTSLFTGIVTLQSVMSTHGNIMTAMPTLMMSLSMLLGTVLFPILSKKYETKRRKKREKLRQEKYRKYLKKVDQIIVEECIHQSKILHENNITLDECVTRIKLKQRNLWERTYEHKDFLTVRLGLGSIPLEADISYSEKSFSMEDDVLKDELYKLVDKPKMLEQVPVTISFLEKWISGLIGERAKVVELVKGIIVQLTALHSYDELKLVFIYDKNEESIWDFVKWLPHVWNKDKTIRYIAENSNEVRELSSYCTAEFKKRKDMGKDKSLEEMGPYYIVFSMSRELTKKAEIADMILENKSNYGFSLVALYDELKNLPKECRTIIELGYNECKIYDKSDITGKHTDFQPDIFLRQNIDDIAMHLANIKLDSLDASYSLPKVLTFLEMYNVSKIEHLNPLERWKKNDPTASLEIPLGASTSGEAFKIDFHERYHGPHGLIAGMTGSGKSELIMTLILSLAVNYHPYEVAFILIDYKGGGMANVFTKLPHLAGTITNLDGAAVNRSLVSIQSELKRRQAIFSETGKKLNVSNIDIYKYQKLYREKLVTEPLQHLFIISDEFAELKTQQPEFMNQLVSAARIGRSLGVHLILATQKPSGVVDDQIWSNTRFRICLKVQEKEDSMDVIKRPDAAELSLTGRFYMQVGFNELFELGQSAWGGAPYYPSEQVEKKAYDKVSIIDNLGHVVREASIDSKKAVVKNPPKQIDEVVNYLDDLAKEENIKVRPLWLEPIPSVVYIESLVKKYGIPKNEKYIFNPIIGEIDDPSNQRQLPMILPITEEGNIVIYGAAGNGKTTFLTTMMYSLMKDHSPSELNIYILDFASETLNAFSKAPHVGDVILSHESEKVNNLFKMLNKEIENRKKILSEYGGDYISYVTKGKGKEETIIVIIHNFSAFTEVYDELEDNVAYLTREGTKYGIYFVITSANTSAVRYRILQNFKQLYVLQLNDVADYPGVLGSIHGVYPSNYRGRGIFKKEDVYEFQTAIVGNSSDSIFEFIRGYCEEYASTWKKAGAKRVPILPEKADVDYFENEIVHNDFDKIPIGVEKASLKTAYYNFENLYINYILSSDNNSASFLEGLADIFVIKKVSELIVIDPSDMFNKTENREYKYAKSDAELENIVVYLFNTLVYRNNTYKDSKEKGEEAPKFERMICIINSMASLRNSLSEDGKNKLNVLLEKCEMEYNVIFVIADAVGSISSYSFETWYKKIQLNRGIWVGDGIGNQYQFKISNMSKELHKNIESDFGYVIVNGKARLIKLLSSKNSEGDDIYG
ncbi:type VII secretion protein EssC [Clostridium hydrogenum]|uniref:type VII secretion protein EssC n=1 Tax=Clostridium hydrogenum TaxID=2855764 RepID=UPI001F2E2F0B|nr:type VII secretion protein EssC [Clostridium hydrogenum]